MNTSPRWNQQQTEPKQHKFEVEKIYLCIQVKTCKLATAVSIIWKQIVGFMQERISLKNKVLWKNKVLNKEAILDISFSKIIQSWSLDNTLKRDQCMRNFKY